MCRGWCSLRLRCGCLRGGKGGGARGAPPRFPPPQCSSLVQTAACIEESWLSFLEVSHVSTILRIDPGPAATGRTHTRTTDTQTHTQGATTKQNTHTRTQTHTRTRARARTPQNRRMYRGLWAPRRGRPRKHKHTHEHNRKNTRTEEEPPNREHTHEGTHTHTRTRARKQTERHTKAHTNTHDTADTCTDTPLSEHTFLLLPVLFWVLCGRSSFSNAARPTRRRTRTPPQETKENISNTLPPTGRRTHAQSLIKCFGLASLCLWFSFLCGLRSFCFAARPAHRGARTPTRKRKENIQRTLPPTGRHTTVSRVMAWPPALCLGLAGARFRFCWGARRVAATWAGAALNTPRLQSAKHTVK